MKSFPACLAAGNRRVRGWVSLRKLSKLILVLIGLFVLAIIHSGTRAILNIDYGALWDALDHLVGSAGSTFG